MLKDFNNSIFKENTYKFNFVNIEKNVLQQEIGLYNLSGEKYIHQRNYELSKKCNLQCDVCIMRLELYRKIVKYDH